MATQYLSVEETSEQLLRYGEISRERISSPWIVASESAQRYSVKAEDISLKIPEHERRWFNKSNLKALSFFLAAWVWI
jgi:hypothetical protein